jgi:hypothetical protein
MFPTLAQEEERVKKLAMLSYRSGRSLITGFEDN